MYSDSDDEGTGDDEDEDMNETNIKQLESLQLEKVVPLSPLRRKERRDIDL